MMKSLRGPALALALFAVAQPGAFARSPQTEAALLSARNGDIDVAVEQIEAATAATPRDADAWMVSGSLLCSQAQLGSKLKAIGRAKRCRDAFAQAIALDAVHPDANIGLMQFYFGAPGIAGGDREKGDKVIAATRTRAPGLHALMLGLKAVMDKDTKAAERHYLRAVALSPKDPRMHSTLISGYASAKSYPQAFAAAEAALAQLPGDATIRFQFARTAAVSGERLAEGLEYLDALDKVEPLPTTVSRAGIAFRRGMILARLGRKPEARASYGAAKRFDARIVREVDAELARL